MASTPTRADMKSSPEASPSDRSIEAIREALDCEEKPVGEVDVVVEQAGAAAGESERTRGASVNVETHTVDETTSWKLDMGKFESQRVTPEEVASTKVAAFYKAQNDLIDLFTRTANMRPRPAGHVPVADEDGDSDEETAHAKRAVKYSFAANVALVIIKVIAAVMSGSLAVVASTVDSALDILSGSIVYFAARAARNRNPYLYPQSKTRLAPLAIIVFASIMGVSALQIISEAAQVLAGGFGGDEPDLEGGVVTFAVLACVIITKLLLYLYCRAAASDSPSVEALVQDHFNDTITNFASVVALLVAVEVPSLWFLDAGFAAVFAVYIVVVWAQTGREQIQRLAGKVADPACIAQLTFLAYNHSPKIQYIDTVRAYHFGSNLLVEVDVVLPPDMPLNEAHDIGESLQNSIETLSSVERCFVHLDTEFDHAPEHKRQ